MQSQRAARAYQTHLATPARRPSRPGQLTTHNRVPNTGIRRVRAQMGARGRVTTNIQAPNTVGASRRRAVQDMNAQNTRRNRVQNTKENRVQYTKENRVQYTKENRVQNTGENRVQNTGENRVQNTGENRVQVT